MQKYRMCSQKGCNGVRIQPTFITRTLMTLLGLLMVSACGVEPGSFSMSFSWDEPPEGVVYIWVRVEERSDPEAAGSILASAGPEAFQIGQPVALEMGDVPNGDNRYVIAEVRETANANVAVLFYGVSEPFSLEAGEHTHVEVPMSFQKPETELYLATVNLLFDDVQRDTVGLNAMKTATLLTRSAGATGMMIANDASFDAGFSQFAVGGEDGVIACTTEEKDGTTWDNCVVSEWNLLEGLATTPEGTYEDGLYTVFIKFLDRYDYESQVYKATVVLDSQPPLVIVASLTPPVARPGGEVYLNVSFHEKVGTQKDSAVLKISPILPAGSTISEPKQVGNSNAYVWTLAIGDGEVDESQEYTFLVDVTDELDNVVTDQVLLDEAEKPLAMRIDATPPQLLEPDTITVSKELFGMIDDGSELTFDFVLEELNHHQVEEVDGICSGICPEVRLNNKLVGKVSRALDEDDQPNARLGFHYVYKVDIADPAWALSDKEVEISINWSDEAGNTSESTLKVKPRFDFLAPYAFSYTLLPAFGNGNDTFSFNLTASEPLAEVPELRVISDSGELFTEAPQVTADGYTYTWEQSAAGLANQIFTVEARMIDMASNVSVGDEGFICKAEASVDGAPPVIDNPTVATSPVVTDAGGGTVAACGHGDKLLVTFQLDEPDGLPEGYPEVMLSVPGAPLPLELTNTLPLEDGKLEFQFEVLLDELENLDSEGLWPVRVTVQDNAGNQLVEEPLADEFVQVDFTAPQAECSLIPASPDAGYPIGQKVLLQITPVEELEPGFVPILHETFIPNKGNPHFLFETDSTYRFSQTITDGDGEHSFELGVILRDLVGNETLADLTACSDGLMAGTLDGDPPSVEELSVLVDDGGVDASITPLREGRVLSVTLTVAGSPLEPVVMVGKGKLSAVGGSVETSPGKYQWVFTRTLDGTEGEGSESVSVTGEDAAGNDYYYMADDQSMVLDFTPPSATCKLNLPSSKIGDKLVATINSSEELSNGLPEFTSDLVFDSPQPDLTATSFEFTHVVTETDAQWKAWAALVTLTDIAGNISTGEYVCEISGNIDAEAPQLDNGVLETDPIVSDQSGDIKLAVGDSDRIVATFLVQEEQGLKEGSPNVYLDVAGAPVEFAQVSLEAVESGFAASYELLLKKSQHSDKEGLWPVKVQLEDLAGNVSVVEGLGQQLVRVDFTPPVAECTLIPEPSETGYAIGQKVTLQVLPLEELEKDYSPQMVETFEPEFAGAFLMYEEGSSFRYSRTVLSGYAEHDFEFAVLMRDLVGNETPVDSTACSGGLLMGAIDGSTPVVEDVELVVEEGQIDPLQTPLRAGLVVTVKVKVSGTTVEPEVHFGDALMAVESGPEDDGPGIVLWVFTRTLDGNETEGSAHVLIEGSDEAGNPYSVVPADIEALLDFTSPTAKCKVTPPTARLDSTIVITATVSELLQVGKPEFESSLVFDEPAGGMDETLFEYEYTVGPGDFALTAWTYTLSLTDLAGNTSTGQACEGGGGIDALAPELLEASVVTVPEVIDDEGVTHLAVGDSDKVMVTLTVKEEQGLKEDSPPQLSLQAGSETLAFALLDIGEIDSVYTCAYELTLSKSDHSSLQGSWPLRLTAIDAAGNDTVVDGMTGKLVKVDFEPPQAECALIPAPEDVGYSIGQKVTLQVSPLEKLEKDFLPVIDETLSAGLPEALFSYEADTSFRYYRTILDSDGEGNFSLNVRLRDLVGNETDVDATACSGGELSGNIDGDTPVVNGPVVVAVDGGAVDPTLNPVRAGRKVVATFAVAGTAVMPVVLLGQGSLSSTQDEPIDLGNSSYEWSFERTLDGSEGEGEQFLEIEGEDAAGNIYNYTVTEVLLSLDFTPPIVSCKFTPELAPIGSTITLTINTSEPLLDGYPEITSNILLTGSPADDGQTYFQYIHPVTNSDIALQEWEYEVRVKDRAGNATENLVACEGVGNIDAALPLLSQPVVTTDPVVLDGDGIVPAVGPGDTIIASFAVAELQGLKEGFPKVALDITGDHIAFGMTDSTDVGDGNTSYTYELALAPNLQVPDDSWWEGNWPVRVELEDKAGNNQVFGSLSEDLVRVDIQPPQAECSLIPDVGDGSYAINQKISIQISALEALATFGEPVEVVETTQPDFGGAYFAYENNTTYRYSHTVQNAEGDRDFTARVLLTDLVGNTTAADETACVGGVISGAVDGTRPDVEDVQLSLQGSDDDPTEVPLMKGRILVAQIDVANTDNEPVVKLETNAMAKSSGPFDLGNETWRWTFTRTLTGNEGDGVKSVVVSGNDNAGNTYQYTEEDSLVTLDFTPPTAQCTASPSTAIVGDTVVLQILTSEPLMSGLPAVSGDIGFVAPQPDLQAISFTYTLAVNELDQDSIEYSWSVALMDEAGNNQEGDKACSGVVTIDSETPISLGGTLVTVPEVVDNDGETVLRVGHGDKLVAVLYLYEENGLVWDFALVVPGEDEIPFSTVSVIPLVPGVSPAEYTLELEMDEIDHAYAEGYRDFKLEMSDSAGNEKIIDTHMDWFVTVDFTRPAAACTLSPPQPEDGYAIGETISVQVTPFEEIAVGYEPEVTETSGLGYTFFNYEADSSYTYSGIVQDKSMEGEITFKVRLQDLVGNVTEVDATACKQGLITASYDAKTPAVFDVSFATDEGGLDPTTDKIRSGIKLSATIQVDNSNQDPTVSIGSSAMTKESGPTSVGEDRWQWVYYRTIDGQVGDGQKYLTLVGTDAAGNDYTYTEPDYITFDFTPPVAQCFVDIEEAKAGDEIEVSVISAEHLGAPPSIQMGDGDTVVFAYDEEYSAPDGNPPRFYWKYTVPGNIAPESWSMTISAQDDAGNPDPISSLCVVGGYVDGVFVTLSEPAVTASYFDDDEETWVETGLRAKDLSRIQIVFTVSNQDDVSKVLVTVGDGTAVCTNDGNSYTCYYYVDADGASGESTVPVTVQVWDDVNNLTAETLDMLTLDFDVPAAAGTAYLERCDNYAPAREQVNELYVNDIDDATCSYDGTASEECGDPQMPPPGGQLRVTFGASETLNHSRSRVYVDGPYEFTIDPCGSGGYVYAIYNPTGAEDEGAWLTLYGLLEDSAGNQATVELGLVWFDFTAPDSPDVDTEGRITYKRIPWGFDESTTQGNKLSSPRFTVSGEAGAVEAYALVTIYDDDNINTANEIGTEDANSSGEFGDGWGSVHRLYLDGIDRTYVYISATDYAGNVSDSTPLSPSPHAALIRDVEWIATPGNKVAGITLQNPHKFTAVNWQQEYLVQNDELEVGADAGLSSRDGDTLYTKGRDLSWQNSTPAEVLVPGRQYHRMVYDAGRGVIVMGSSYQSDLPGEVWEWDGYRWEQRSPVDPEEDGEPGARYSYGLAYDRRRGVTVMYGGNNGADELWEWDGISWDLVTPEDPEEDGNPVALSNHAMAYDSLRAKVVLFGGYGGGYKADTWEWDGTSWELVDIADPESDGNPSARSSMSMAYDANRDVMVMFGGKNSAGTKLGDTWEYDGDSWDAIIPTDVEGDGNPAIRHHYAMSYDSFNEEVVMHGGYETGDGYDEIWWWDGTRWDLRNPSDPQGDGSPDGRKSHAMAYDEAREELILLGGTGTYDNYTTWAFSANSWENRGPAEEATEPVSPAQLKWHAGAYDPQRQRTVLFGGTQDLTDEQDDTWEFDGTTWSLIVPDDDEGDGNPEEMYGHTMTWQSSWSGGEVALWGGKVSGGYNDFMWFWDGERWDKITNIYDGTDGNPDGVRYGAMSYDIGRSRIVLFGGHRYASGNYYLDETWEFYRTYIKYQGWKHVWVERTPSDPEGDGNPGQRYHHAIAYDDSRDVTVMYGGEKYSHYDDTWEWNGSSWDRIVPTDPEDDGNPGDRGGHTMAYANVRGRVVLCHGGDDSDTYGDCWDWDGTSWAQLLTGDPDGDGDPLGRKDGMMVYDGDRAKLVLQGGYGVSSAAWRGSFGHAFRPANFAQFHFWAAGNCETPEFKQLDITLRAGGKSYLGSGTYNGAKSYLWDEGDWVQTDYNTSSLASPSDLEKSITDEQRLDRIFYGPLETINLMVTPRYNNQKNHAELKTDYMEISVHYRLAADADTQCE
jgi:hypothetical protein